MKLALLLLALLSTTALAANETKTSEDLQYYGYGAFDTTYPATLMQLSCLRQQGYRYAFVGVYNPDGQGNVYPYAADNLLYAQRAGLGIYAFVTPAVNSWKTAAAQFQETYFTLKREGNLTMFHVWLHVTDPISWPKNPQRNAGFIYDYIRAAAGLGVKVGIYTNWYDWQQITGNWRLEGQDLWYWETFGVGEQASGSIGFNDFRPFGGFTIKDVVLKQYTKMVHGCVGIEYGRNSYLASSRLVEMGNGVVVEPPKKA
uniref:GH26 domain-containing protein n=1 Tax=Steinernema glaseri TaxID=37863 RepID=A0A1I7YK10_9BILA